MTRTKTTRPRRTRGTTTAATLAVALIGITLGVAGGAHAADLITGKQIKDGTVTGRDVRNGTIVGADVAAGSLTPDDYAGVTTGPPGPQGETGRKGPDGLEYLYDNRSTIEFLNPGQIGTAVAQCEPGHVAVGGGMGGEAGRRTELLDSAPFGTDPVGRRAWVVRVLNDSGINVRVTAWAICAEVQP